VLLPSNESTVLVCRVEAYSTPCFTGVYISNGNGLNGLNGARGWVLVPNGNNNGNSWIRVGLNGNNLRIYTVVATIPLYYWVPGLLAYFTLTFYTLSQRVRIGRRRVLYDPSIVTMALLIVLTTNALLVGAVYVDQATPRYNLPGLSISWHFNLEESTLKATLDLGGVYELVNASCRARLNGNGLNGNGRAFELNVSIIGENIVVATIPSYIYELLFNSTTLEPIPPIPADLSVYAAIPIQCRFTLDKAIFESTYLATFYWRDLVLHIVKSSVLVNNPNPVRVNTTIYIVDLERGRLLNSTSVLIGPLSSVWIDLGVYGAGVYRVIVQYDLLGLVRTRVVEVAVSQEES
jgi:hypothetical protein